MRHNHRVITTAAQVTTATAASGTGPAILAALAVVLIWRHSHFRDGKGTIPGRLLGVVLAMFMAWLLLAVTHPADAEQVAAGTASGVSVLLSAAAHLVGAS
jgi:hypothetical protein